MKKSIESTSIIEEYEIEPRISVVLPFNQKMKKQPELVAILTAEADKIEKKLLINFPEVKVEPVVKKLGNLITRIHSTPNGKSVGIFISSLTEKVYYFSPSHLEDYKLS